MAEIDNPFSCSETYKVRLYLIGFFLLVATACQSSKTKPLPTNLNNLADSLEFVLQNYQTTLGTPKVGEWRFLNKELPQTFQDYWLSKPTRATSERYKIYVQLYGDFDSAELRLMDSTLRLLEVFYRLPIVKMPLKELNTTKIDKQNYRPHERFGVQFKTYFFLDSLQKNLPDDAVMAVGFTNADVYPNQQWNFVFGQARLKQRVGIWSIARFETEKDFTKSLQRTCKTAIHEIGHIFSIRHCEFYRCAMQGSNNLMELDAHPLYFCPICDAKLISNLDLPLFVRYQELEQFWKNQHDYETGFYYKNAKQAALRLSRAN